MKRLYNLLLLLLPSCSNLHTIAMNPGLIEEKAIPSDSFVGPPIWFTTSDSDLVFFTKKGITWVATLIEKLSTGFSRKVEMAVHCGQVFDPAQLPNYSPEQQKRLIHIEKASNGESIVYLGKRGLPGGGGKCSHSGYYKVEPNKDPKVFTCLQCGYRVQGPNEEIRDAVYSHYCKKCNRCRASNKCICYVSREKRYCKQCCGCSTPSVVSKNDLFY